MTLATWVQADQPLNFSLSKGTSAWPVVWSPFVVGRCKRSGRYFASRESSQEHTISIRHYQSATCKKTERPVWLLREIRTEATRGKDDRALLLEVLACFIFFRNGFTRGLGQHAASLLVQDAAHRAVVHQELLHLGLTTLQGPSDFDHKTSSNGSGASCHDVARTGLVDDPCKIAALGNLLHHLDEGIGNGHAFRRRKAKEPSIA